MPTNTCPIEMKVDRHPFFFVFTLNSQGTYGTCSTATVDGTVNEHMGETGGRLYAMPSSHNEGHQPELVVIKIAEHHCHLTANQHRLGHIHTAVTRQCFSTGCGDRSNMCALRGSVQCTMDETVSHVICSAFLSLMISHLPGITTTLHRKSRNNSTRPQSTNQQPRLLHHACSSINCKSGICSWRLPAAVDVPSALTSGSKSYVAS